MQPSIGENVIGPVTPARPHSPSNRHHQLDLSPAPPTKQISDDSTFNVLQLNANRIGNKLTEVEVVLERNKVKVITYIQEPLHPELHYSALRIGSHGQGGLLIFIHRSITFSKQPSLPESLSDPHLEELSIKAELGNTKLIISNVYIPPASSCSNGYHSSIEHLLTTPDALTLGDFNAHYLSWYSRSTDTRGRKMGDSINGSDWYSQLGQPHKCGTEFARCLISITSCSWQTLSTLSSDHLPILIRLQMKTPSNPGLRRTYVNLKRPTGIDTDGK